MAYLQKWLQSTDVRVDEATGAILVHAVPATAQRDFDLLAFAIYHVEGIEEVVWDVQYALAEIADPAFTAPLLSGDTSVDFDGLFCRIDYRGVPGTITPLTAAGIATRLSEIDGEYRSGSLLVPLDEAFLATLIPGRKYLRRARQKARGHDEWGVWHDEIIIW